MSTLLCFSTGGKEEGGGEKYCYFQVNIWMRYFNHKKKRCKLLTTRVSISRNSCNVFMCYQSWRVPVMPCRFFCFFFLHKTIWCSLVQEEQSVCVCRGGGVECFSAILSDFRLGRWELLVGRGRGRGKGECSHVCVCVYVCVYVCTKRVFRGH